MVLASRGLRDLDRGPERIGDSDELRTVRSQARRVVWLSSMCAAVTTAVVVLLLP